MHQELRHGIAVEHDREYAFHRVLLRLVITLLELGTEFLERRLVGGVVLVDEGVGIFEKGRHVRERMASGPVLAAQRIRVVGDVAPVAHGG